MISKGEKGESEQNSDAITTETIRVKGRERSVTLGLINIIHQNGCFES